MDFTPENGRTQCFTIGIADNNVLEEDKNLTLLLSSDDPRVEISQPHAVMEVLDDDSELIGAKLAAHTEF